MRHIHGLSYRVLGHISIALRNKLELDCVCQTFQLSLRRIIVVNCVCVFVCVRVCVYVSMFVCMSAYVYACVCVCLSAYVGASVSRVGVSVCLCERLYILITSNSLCSKPPKSDTPTVVVTESNTFLNFRMLKLIMAEMAVILCAVAISNEGDAYDL